MIGHWGDHDLYGLWGGGFVPDWRMFMRGQWTDRSAIFHTHARAARRSAKLTRQT